MDCFLVFPVSPVPQFPNAPIHIKKEALNVISNLNTQTDSVRSLYGKLLNKSNLFNDSDDNWLITLSDVLSLLLIFFIMFLVLTKSFSSPEMAQPVKYQNPVLPYEELKQETLIVSEWMRDEITSSINSLDLGDEVSVRTVDKGIIITMKEKVTFRPAAADILESSNPILSNIAEVIKKYPSFQVEIEGHTDNIPIKTSRYPSNWELSVSRATNVLKFFIDNHSIDPSRFSIKGIADQKPVAHNDTPENRARNRRVEIRLKESGESM